MLARFLAACQFGAIVFAASALVAQAQSTGVESQAKQGVTALGLLQGALELTRGVSSYSEMAMRVHRPDWERSSALVAWTRGDEDALIRFTAPAKDAGNATLKKGDQMWTYAPKVKRSIRLPGSLMSQSWASSDFSYNDLARSDKLVKYYALNIIDAQIDGERTLYTIEAIPFDDAPIVWGKEIIVIRDDYVVLSQTFFDQAMTALKKMESLEIGALGGRTIATKMRMTKLDDADHWTEIEYLRADFSAEIDPQKFTTFALTSGR